MTEQPKDQIIASASIATDTATLCIFDLAALRHRVDDVGDWWSIPRTELQELVSRNVAILTLGSDGQYQMRLLHTLPKADLRVSLAAPSGRFFVGPGEEISGGGFEPTGEWGGFFVELSPGDYELSVHRNGQRIDMSLTQVRARSNDFTDLIRI